MGKLVEIGLVAIAGGAIVLGSYNAGKLSERKWWRSELAAKSQAVAATMKQLGDEVDTLDASLLRALGEDDARLTQAEDALRRASQKSPVGVAPDSTCPPVRAVCLRRPG